MFNIRPMPVMGGPIRPQIQGPLPGAGAVGPATQPAGAPVMANPGAIGRSFSPMAPTMGNHFVNQV